MVGFSQVEGSRGIIGAGTRTARRLSVLEIRERIPDHICTK